MTTTINGEGTGDVHECDINSDTNEEQQVNDDNDDHEQVPYREEESSPPTQETTATTTQNNKKICRICLEEEEEDGDDGVGDDHNDNDNDATNNKLSTTTTTPTTKATNSRNNSTSKLISPCLCKGTSKYVHRTCLDEWRACREDRAFSKCTECLFEYYMEPTLPESTYNQRRRKYMCLVVRDLLGLVLILQLCIIVLGAMIGLMDRNSRYFPNDVMNCGGGGATTTMYDDDDGEDVDGEKEPTGGENQYDTILIDNNSTLVSSTNETSMGYNTTTAYDEGLDDVQTYDDDAVCVYGTYYLFGFLLFLAILGVYGLLVLCRNGWSQQDAMSDARTYNYSIGTTASQRSTTATTNRRCCCGSSSTQSAATDGCFYGCYFGGCCDNNCCDNCCPGDVGGSCVDNECCCCFAMVFGTIAAVLGVVYFILFGIAISQQVFQRHLFLLKKKRFVAEYRVLDLSAYKDKDDTNLTTIQEELLQEQSNAERDRSSRPNDDDDHITSAPPGNLEMNDRGSEKDDCGGDNAAAAAAADKRAESPHDEDTKKNEIGKNSNAMNGDNSMTLSSLSTRLSQSDIQQLKTLGLME